MTIRIIGRNPTPATVAALVRREAEARAKGASTCYVRAPDGRPVGLLIMLPERERP